VLDDGRLLERIANGEHRAFEVLVTVYQARFLAVAEGVTGDRASAEDAVQEAFLRILRFASDVDGRRDPKPWLFRICVNCARDEAIRRSRCSRREANIVGGDAFYAELATPLALMVKSEEKALLADMVSRLEPDFRTMLMLRFTADLKYEQIARALGIPVGTVKSRLHAAVEKLRAVAEVQFERYHRGGIHG